MVGLRELICESCAKVVLQNHPRVITLPCGENSPKWISFHLHLSIGSTMKSHESYPRKRPWSIYFNGDTWWFCCTGPLFFLPSQDMMQIAKSMNALYRCELVEKFMSKGFMSYAQRKPGFWGDFWWLLQFFLNVSFQDDAWKGSVGCCFRLMEDNLL